MEKAILKQFLKETSFIGININPDNWDEVVIGFITNVNNNNLTLKEIDKDGKVTGDTIVPLDNILRVDFDDRYQRRLKFIYDNAPTLDSTQQVTVWNNGSNLKNYFKVLKKSKKIVTFYFNEDQYNTGILLDYDKDNFLVKNMGSQGDEEGLSCYFLDNLVGLKYDGIDERKIKLLYDNSKRFYI